MISFIFYFLIFFIMKKLIALTTGLAMLMLAIAPALAGNPTQAPDTEIDVGDYLNFTTTNADGTPPCGTAAFGDCPFGTTGNTTLAPTATTDWECSDGGTTSVDTNLQVTTNTSDGYSITVQSAAVASAQTMEGQVSADTVPDTVAVMNTLQGGPPEVWTQQDTLATSTDTGLAMRIESTSTTNYTADMTTTWGTDNGSTCASGVTTGEYWGAIPYTSGTAEPVYEYKTYSIVAQAIIVEWFVGVDNGVTEDTYDQTITFTAIPSPAT